MLIKFICNDCVYRCGIELKHPADSGNQSWFCDKCQHYNIGSYMKCEIDSWLRIIPFGYSHEA